MNIPSRLFVLVFILSFFNIKAQNFPYLNASTGNENEFVICADSSILMFHGDRLEKLDKNYNPIWIKSYGGLIFKNILLSKTGSMYFIASNTVSATSDKIGKIEKDGSFAWGKVLSTATATVLVGNNTNNIYPFDWNHLFLDRNNDLTLIGNSGYFLKMDTLGNIKSFKFFDYFTANAYTPETSIILNDSVGVYTISTWGLAFEGAYTNLIYKYSDHVDSVIKEINNITWVGILNTGENMERNGHVIKSKHTSNSFYLNYCMDGKYGAFPNTFVLEKINMSNHKWRMEIINSSPYLSYFEGLDEDDKKNTFVSMSTYNVNLGTRDKWFWKIDSNGYTSHQKFNTILNFGKPTAFIFEQDSATKLTYHYGKKYIYSVESSKSNLAPLIINKLDSTLGLACSPPSIIPISTGHYVNILNWQNPRFKSYTINNSVFQTITTSAFSIINYTVSTTKCITNSIEDILNKDSFSLYPNPANNILTLSSNKNFEIIEISIFDINAKSILMCKNNSSIDVSKLTSGIYFIKIKTDKGEFSQKFIKE